ncbi:MAG TPA: hypothetical protein VMR77_00200 [Patescibacteria group bacterium]|jgi:hypothetical protein|nr:hypothetical protein [Patescibacteria group bacterium]
MEAKLAKRLAAAAVVTALAVSGCASRNDVNGSMIVDCKNGPRSQEKTATLGVGDEVGIGGTTPGFGNHDYTRIGFDKGAALTITNPGGDWKLRYSPNSEPQLGDNETGMDKDGTIFIRSFGIDYVIKSTVTSDNAVLDITATCEPQTNS